jgi:hypothetical protein
MEGQGRSHQAHRDGNLRLLGRRNSVLSLESLMPIGSIDSYMTFLCRCGNCSLAGLRSKDPLASHQKSRLLRRPVLRSFAPKRETPSRLTPEASAPCSLAKGCSERDRASGELPHRKPITIYESRNSSGRNNSNDKNESLKKIVLAPLRIKQLASPNFADILLHANALLPRHP